jgi:hypothetical protein
MSPDPFELLERFPNDPRGGRTVAVPAHLQETISAPDRTSFRRPRRTTTRLPRDARRFRSRNGFLGADASDIPLRNRNHQIGYHGIKFVTYWKSMNYALPPFSARP